MELRNAQYKSDDLNLVDCELNHEVYGWIPTTIDMAADDRPGIVDAVNLLPIASYVAPVIPTAIKIQLIKKAVQQHADETAVAQGYYNIQSCAKYVGYENPYRAECESLCGWLATCWQQCHTMLADWEAGNIPEHTPEEVVASLPEYTS